MVGGNDSEFHNLEDNLAAKFRERISGLICGRAVEARVTGDPVPSAPKAPMSLLKGAYRTQEIDLAEGRPKHIREIELAICALPEEKA
jgi:hypothetical protein